MSADTVRRWPVIEAVVRNDGSGEVRIDGTSYPVATSSLEEARVEVLRRVTESAVAAGRPVRASAEGPEGIWRLVVHPDGTVVPEEDGPTPSGPTPVVTRDDAGPAAPAPDPEPDVTRRRIPLSPPPVRATDPFGEPAPEPGHQASAAPAPAGAAGNAPAGPAPDPAPPAADTPAAPAPAPDVAVGYVAVEGLTPDTDPGGRVPNGSRLDPGLRAPASQHARTAPSSPRVPERTGVPDPFHPDDGPGSRAHREARGSFLTQVSVEEPAEQGFRGWLTRIGVRIPPSTAERAIRADEREVSQHWPGPRTISIVNGKGGAGKTPSTVLLSAVFAQYGGAGVVAWDNNQTRGTLGWRTEKGPHDATLLDLLPRTDHLLGPSAQAADLARYVHHQTRDRYDVLRSKPMAMANEQRIDPSDVDAIHSVLSKYYRLIVIDSGNDESDPMWQRMIDLSDQLVIATTTRDDHAEAGALLLEGLAERDGRSAYLAQQAVVVVSQADQKAPPAEIRKVAAGYAPIAREVVTVPFDPGMVDGHLRHGALRPATRRAWLAAGAAVARGL
ncbi:AAA family ATPase [Myceligenerans crystallogenes]|uniref:MinD-like ATPase involved in chromosome partitioning or flagellar assembly n=1 Tax=Myceligenerans crystallogenes TaxID=316335 RepID=A0ABN2NGT4_9MICO